MGFWKYSEKKSVSHGFDVQKEWMSAKENQQPSYASASQ